MSVAHDDGFFPAHDGLRLYYRRWRGDGEPKAIIALVHGYLEHSGRYGFVGEHFAPRGFTVYGFDHRGHGQSNGPRAYIERFGDYLSDVSRYLELIREREGAQKPIFLVGHSLGGLIALRYTLEHPEGVRAVVVSSPFLGNKVPISGGKLFAVRIMGRLLPTIALDAGLDPKQLSHDPAVIEAHQQDPLVLQKFTTRWATEALGAQEWVLANAARLTLPSYFQVGMADSIADPAVARAVFERITHSEKRWSGYDGFFHEIYNEVGREQVFADLAGYLSGRLAADPS